MQRLLVGCLESGTPSCLSWTHRIGRSRPLRPTVLKRNGDRDRSRELTAERTDDMPLGERLGAYAHEGAGLNIESIPSL